jgi:hypothetical protein
MKRILLAVAVAAAPAVARAQDRDGWDHGSWSDDGQAADGYRSGDEQYPADWSQPDDDSWQSSADDSGYAQESGPTFDEFRGDSALTWNGEWIDTPEYGTVWRPTRISSDWQPYTYGRWVWTREGWAWASDEPFGWAVYHYGRWAWSPAAGWMWVPGRVWAPAWVTWRWSDGYAAWCPMGVRDSYVEQPAVWVVVPTRTFLEPVSHHVVPRTRRRVLPLPMPSALRTGPAAAWIERATGRAVRPLPISEARNPSAARVGPGSVIFYRPHATPVAQPARTAQPAPQGPRVVPPTSGPGRPERPRWFGAPVPSVQPRPQPVQAQQWPRPVQAQPRPASPQAPVAVPRAAPAANVQPHPAPAAAPTAPHAVAPVARSNAEQQQVKER